MRLNDVQLQLHPLQCSFAVLKFIFDILSFRGYFALNATKNKKTKRSISSKTLIHLLYVFSALIPVFLLNYFVYGCLCVSIYQKS